MLRVKYVEGKMGCFREIQKQDAFLVSRKDFQPFSPSLSTKFWEMRGQPYYRYSPLYFSFISRTLWFRQDSRHGSVRLQVSGKRYLQSSCGKVFVPLKKFNPVSLVVRATHAWAHKASCEGTTYYYVWTEDLKEDSLTHFTERPVDVLIFHCIPIQWGPGCPNVAW